MAGAGLVSNRGNTFNAFQYFYQGLYASSIDVGILDVDIMTVGDLTVTTAAVSLASVGALYGNTATFTGALSAGSVATAAAAVSLATLGNTYASTLNVSGATVLNSLSAASATLTSPLTVASGGTGLTTIPSGSILYGNGTSAISTTSSLTYDGTTFSVLGSPTANTFRVGATGGGDGFLVTALTAGNGSLIGAVNSTMLDFTQLQVAGDNVLVNLRTGVGTSSNYAKFSNNISTWTANAAGLELYGPTNYAVLKLAGASGSDSFLASGTVGLYLNATTAVPIIFATNNVERMRIDSSGNFGLGVTPAAWTSFKALQIGYGSIASLTTQFNVGFNYYYDGTNFRYLTTNNASLYTQASGYHYFSSSPTGNAGDPITFVERMRIDSSGNLLLGTSTNDLGGSSNAIFGASKSGGSSDLLVYNPSNTAGSHARIWISDGGTSAGSAGLLFTSGLGGTRLAMGLDSTDSDKFKIGNGYTPGSGSTFLTIDTSGKLNVGTVSAIYGGIQSTVGAGTAVPTLGTGSGHLTLSNGAYGLAAGVDTSGDTWLQAHRFDGTATAYNLLLQPVGGRVSIGLSGAPSGTLEIRDSSGAQAVFSYDASNYAGFTVNGSGVLTIAPTSNSVVLAASSLRVNQTPAGSAGASTGTYMAINLNGTDYKIALLANA